MREHPQLFLAPVALRFALLFVKPTFELSYHKVMHPTIHVGLARVGAKFNLFGYPTRLWCWHCWQRNSSLDKKSTKYARVSPV